MQENKVNLLLSGNIGTRSNPGHLTAKYIKRTKMFSYRSVIQIFFSLRIQLAMLRTGCLL